MKKYKNIDEVIDDKELKKSNPVIYLTGPHWKDRMLTVSINGYNLALGIAYKLIHAGFTVLCMPVYAHPFYIREGGKDKTVQKEKWNKIRKAVMGKCDVVLVLDYRLVASPIEDFEEVVAELEMAKELEKPVVRIPL